MQATIWREFYSVIGLNSGDFAEKLGTWLMYYNYQRIRISLGVTPIERFWERIGSPAEAARQPMAAVTAN